MKYLFFILLLIANISYSQPTLGVFKDVNSFQSAYLMGDPFDAVVYLQNTGDRTFTGDVDVEIRVSYPNSVSFSKQLWIISFNNLTLQPKEYVPVNLNVFTISDIIFQEGDDIVIIWPKVAPNTNIQISDTVYQTINVTVQADYTLLKRNENNYIKAYPNPTKGIINLTNVKEIKTIKLYSSEGKLLKTIEPQKEINISDFQEGIYYLLIITNEDKKHAIVLTKE